MEARIIAVPRYCNLSQIKWDGRKGGLASQRVARGVEDVLLHCMSFLCLLSLCSFLLDTVASVFTAVAAAMHHMEITAIQAQGGRNIVLILVAPFA